MKTKMLTALLSSLFLAILACPVLAAPIDMLVAGYGLDASAIPTTFDAETVLGWWLSDGFVTHPLGALFVFLLALCACALIAYPSALKSRPEAGGVLGHAGHQAADVFLLLVVGGVGIQAALLRPGGKILPGKLLIQEFLDGQVRKAQLIRQMGGDLPCRIPCHSRKFLFSLWIWPAQSKLMPPT